MSTTITTYPHGFTPVERNPLNLTPKHPDSAPFIPLDKLLSTIPNTPLVKKALEYLKPLLPVPMFNHSNRAYLYGEWKTRC